MDKINETKDDIRDGMRKLLKDIHLKRENGLDAKTLDLILKYYSIENIKFNDEEEKELKEIYDFHLQKEVENVNKKFQIKGNEIKKIVSAFSYSNKNKFLTEYPFEKDLRAFPNVEEILLLYTDEIEAKYNEAKKEIEKKSKIFVTGVKIDGSTVKGIYNKLKELIINGKISRKDTILDTTLGMRTFAIAFYRISSERGIKSINWNEKFFTNYSGILDKKLKKEERETRIDLTAKFIVTEEPLIESRINYELINKSLDNLNYEAVSGFYKMLGIDDLSFFFSILNEIFCVDKMFELSSEEFFEKMEKNLRKLFEYSEYEEENKKKLKNVVIYLLTLVYYDENDYIDENDITENKLEWFNVKNNVFHITENDLKRYVEDFIFDEKTKTFYKTKYFWYLKLKYAILSNKPDFYIEEIKQNIIDEEIIKFDTNKRVIFNSSKNIEEIHDMIFWINEDINENLLLTKFNIENYLKEEEIPKLVFRNNILTIPHYKLPEYCIKINFNEEKILKNMRKGYVKYIPIYELLENMDKRKHIPSEEVKEIIIMNSSSPVTKIFRDMKKEVDKINKVIIEKMAEEGIEVGDFLKIEEGNENYSIFISDKF